LSRTKATAYVFLDTNMFLEFLPFDQIDWPTELNYQQVCLVLAPVNHTEFEKFKYDRQSDRRRKRSRLVTAKLNQILGSTNSEIEVAVPGRSNVTLWELAHHPTITDYPGLQVGHNDDELLATVLKFIADHSDIPRKDVFLMSDDGGVLRRGRTFNLQTLPPNQKLRLADEPTEDQEELKRLRQQLQEQQNRMPKLRLAAMETQVEVEVIQALDPEVLERFVAAEEKRTRWTPPPESETQAKQSLPNPADPLGIRSLFDLQNQKMAGFGNHYMRQVEIDNYQQDFNSYLTKYRRYLAERYRSEQLSALTRKWEIVLRNEGTKAATELLIQLSFPIDFDVSLDVDSLTQPLKLPKPPEPPPELSPGQRAFSMLNNFPMPNIPVSPTTFGYIPPPGSLRGRDPDREPPTITRNSACVLVEWHRSRIIHDRDLKLTPLFVRAPAVLGKRQYEIPYQVKTETLSHPQKGKLVIQVLGKARPLQIEDL
jgi:hypothetical protein